MDTVLEAVSIVAENQIPDLGITEWVLGKRAKSSLETYRFSE
jgi:hypothetical protein